MICLTDCQKEKSSSINNDSIILTFAKPVGKDHQLKALNWVLLPPTTSKQGCRRQTDAIGGPRRHIAAAGFGGKDGKDRKGEKGGKDEKDGNNNFLR